MSEKKKELEELDIAGLLALKAFERPDPKQLEKDVEKTMNAGDQEYAHQSPGADLKWREEFNPQRPLTCTGGAPENTT